MHNLDFFYHIAFWAMADFERHFFLDLILLNLLVIWKKKNLYDSILFVPFSLPHDTLITFCSLSTMLASTTKTSFLCVNIMFGRDNANFFPTVIIFNMCKDVS